MAKEGRHLRALTTHQQLITQLEHSRARLLTAIQGLSEQQMSQPVIDGWSVKDHIAHLTVWDEMRFFEISRIARGGAASFPEAGDEVNLAWLNEPTVDNRRPLPLAQVLADMAFARDMVLQAVAICPEDRLNQRLYEEIGIEGGAAHDVSHAETIEAWRKKERI